MLLCFADLQAVEIVLYSIVGSFSRDTCGCWLEVHTWLLE